MRVLSAVDAGTPREQVARTFSVSMPTIKRWLKRRRETGDVEPEPIPGRPPRKGAMLREWLPKHLEANDDLTLEEHRQAFEVGEHEEDPAIGTSDQIGRHPAHHLALVRAGELADSLRALLGDRGRKRRHVRQLQCSGMA